MTRLCLVILVGSVFAAVPVAAEGISGVELRENSFAKARRSLSPGNEMEGAEGIDGNAAPFG